MAQFVERLQLADWIGLATVLIGLIGIVTAYHIAGTFRRKTKLVATFGPLKEVPPAFILVNFTALPRPIN
jgi:hypothetical protein